MEFPFESHGWLTYDPKRGSLKTRIGWWLTIELPNEEIPRYYRWWVDRQWWDADSRPMKRRYLKPPHWPHISIIRGEVPRANKQDWGKYRAGEKITFRYNPIIRQTSNARYAEEPDRFWFIDTQWGEYGEMRRYFGLDWERDGRPFRGHITVARTYD